MHVDVITDLGDLAKLRENWDAIYARDPEAHYFLSYGFLSSYCQRFSGACLILAARVGDAGSPYVAFFPLRLRLRMNKHDAVFHNELNMAGNYAADYTGMIAEPEHGDHALIAFCRKLKALNWRRLHLENLRMSDARIKLIVKHLSDDRIELRSLRRVNESDNIDNAICPIVTLPTSFDAYLDNQVGTNTRQKIRRFLRKVDRADRFRIRHTDATTIAADTDRLLELWRTRWQPRKGDRTLGLVKSFRTLIMEASKDGSLYFPSLWLGERMLGGLIILTDPVKKAMLFLMTGRDETFSEIPAGLVLHGHAIRHAIGQGIETYDFLRGNEPYKYAFGAREVRLTSLLAQTRDGANLGGVLDRRSLNGVLEEAGRLHAAGDLTLAEKVYRQVLHTDSLYPRALYGLGQLLATHGDHHAAANCYATLIGVAANSRKAWLRYAIELQTLERHAEAVAAFRRLLELQPDLEGAEYGLGRSLSALRRDEEAARVLRAVASVASSKNNVLVRAKAEKQLRKLGAATSIPLSHPLPLRLARLEGQIRLPKALTAVGRFVTLN